MNLFFKIISITFFEKNNKRCEKSVFIDGFTQNPNPMFYIIIPASCLLAWWLATDAIKGKTFCLEDENPELVE